MTDKQKLTQLGPHFLSKYDLERLGDPTQVALAQARADKSDPFTYNRVIAHQRSGLHIRRFRNANGSTQIENDYSVELIEHTETISFDNGTRKVTRPHNWRRV